MRLNARIIHWTICLSVVVHIFIGKAIAQPECYFEHFGVEDGLPQHTVMDILQDKNGFMWFATWNGLCKFDGYKFVTYRLSPDINPEGKSNRFDQISEDQYNNIWVLSYDDQAYLFNPQTELFTGVQSLEYYNNRPFYTTKILHTKSGKTWLISEENGPDVKKIQEL